MSDPLQNSVSEAPDESSGKPHHGLPKATVMVSFIVILVAATATFLMMKWSTSKAASQELAAQLEEVRLEEAALAAQLEELKQRREELIGMQGAMGKGPFTFCNYSGESVTIKHLTATYLNDQGQFETFSTENIGSGLWKIAPGSTRTLDFHQGQYVWDGTVTYYSFLLEAEGSEFPIAGVWKPEQQDCVFRWPGG